MNLFLIALIFHQLYFGIQDEGKCVMYGSFDDSHTFSYNGSAKRLQDARAVNSFKKLCSPLLPNNYKDGDPIMTCCSPEQLNYFDSLVQFLFNSFSCYPCLQNINMFTCSLICSPNQSDFILPTINKDNATLVDSVYYAMSNSFVTGLFESCKDVKFVNSIIPLFSLLCESYSGDCTPQKLIESISARSSFKIDVHVFNSTDPLPPDVKQPMNAYTYKCNLPYQSPNTHLSACTCFDCLESCPPTPNIPDSKVYLVLNYFTIWQFSILLIFLAFIFSLIFFAISTRIYKKYIHGRNRGAGINETHSGDAAEWDQDNSSSNTSSDASSIGSEIIDTDIRIRNSALLGKPLRLWGKIVATNRLLFITISLSMLLVFCCGFLYNIEITSDPLDLWSPKHGESRKQKEYIDKTYGPFYRTQQIIVSSTNGTYTTYDGNNVKIPLGPVVQKEIIQTLFNIQNDLFSLNVSTSSKDSLINEYVTLQDICLQPLSPSSDECAFFSVTQYFQNNKSNLNIFDSGNEWPYHLAYCSSSTGSVDDSNFAHLPCLSKFLSPIAPQLVLGGYPYGNFTNATSLIITFVIKNSLESNYKAKVLAWEIAFIDYMKKYSNPLVKVSFSSESSIESELNRQTHADVLTVAISYLVMFLYISFTLGQFPMNDLKLYFVGHKIIIGFAGVVLVLLSVLGSVGFFCYFKFQITLIILEVLPFLLLAVGVDNIFILVHEYQRVSSLSDSSDDVSDDVSVSLGNVGGGMIVSVLCQVVTFSSCSFSNIPAVKSFSLLAAFAMGLNFFMQMTCFLAIFSFDAARERSGRIACIPCLKVGSDDSYRRSLVKKAMRALSIIVKKQFLSIPILFVFFIGWFASLYILLSIPIGLDQTLPLPSDSYLLPYFTDVFHELRAGAPVYFVVETNFKYENSTERSKICYSEHCLNNSLTSQIYSNVLISNYSKLAVAPDSWVDTYLKWLKTTKPISCCSYRYTVDQNSTVKQKMFCPSSEDSKNCSSCIPGPIPDNWEPSSEEFGEYLPWFLKDIPNTNCTLGGGPAYRENVILNQNYYSINRTINDSPVATSRFLTYHVALSRFEDFYDAFVRTFNLAEKISKDISHKVFAYSVFYVFYESYSTIWKQGSFLLGVSVATIFIVNLVLFRFDLRITILVSFTIFAMDLVNALFMYILGINFNPVSLVNLVMLIGINVEFVCHVARAFQDSICESSTNSARDAMANAGSSVLSGIAFTKILGITVLAFSNSLFLKIYYFKMFSIAILVGTLHGLIFLPIALKYVGVKKTNLEYRPFVQEID